MSDDEMQLNTLAVSEEVTHPLAPAPIDIVLKEQPGGMVDSQLLIALRPSEKALAQAARFKNPCYIIVVTKVNEEKRYQQEEPEKFYIQKSAYILPFKSRQKTPWIRFSSPGKNRIWVTITDIHDRHAADWADSVVDKNRTAVDSKGNWTVYAGYKGQGTRDVIVPAQAFSDPPQWQKSWVKQIWPDLGSDDCKFRRKLWFGAVPLTAILQLYGLVVRPLLLAFALIMLKREIRPRLLLAFNPHMVWKVSGESAWFTDKQGKERKGISALVAIISPPVIAALAAVFLGIPGVIYGVADLHWYGTSDKPRHAALWAQNWGYWHTALTVDLWILGCVAMIGALVLIGWVVSKVLPAIKKRGRKLSEEERLAHLKKLLGPIAVDAPDWDTIPDSQKTVRLRFSHIKSRVCRPLPQ